MGSLNSPSNFRHHFQNYSYKTVGMVVGAGEEVSLEYSFQLHPDLDPVDYQISLNVFYDSETETFTSTFFNQTVELYYSTSDYDLEMVSGVLMAIFFTLMTIALAFVLCVPEAKFSSMFFSKAKSILASDGKGGNDDSDDESWEQMQSKRKKNK